MLLLRFAGLCALAATALVLAAPLGPRAASTTPPLVHGRATLQRIGSASGPESGPLRAGAARVPLALEPGMNLAGYPSHRHVHAGGEALYSRALVVEAGAVRQIVVALETMLVPGSLEEEVLRRAGLAPETCLLFAATHTHSGPGGTWQNALAEWAGNGFYDARERDLIAQAVADSIARAIAALGPASVSWAQAPWPDGPSRARSGGALDTEVTTLEFTRPGGAVIATLVDYAMHPTVEPRARDALSADWPGRAAAELETRGGVALVLQGASGNASPDHQHTSSEAGAQVAARSTAVLQGAAVHETGKLGCEVRLVSLPPAQVGANVPWPLRRGASNLLALFAEPWTVQTRLSIDGLDLLGVPGEAVGGLGLSARARAGHPLAIVGLADDYVGYVEEPARAAQGEGEASRSYHGPGLAEALGL